MPVASDHLALERRLRADRHRQHVPRLRNAVELDEFDEPDIAVGNGFRGILSLTANAQRRNFEADLKHALTILPDGNRRFQRHGKGVVCGTGWPRGSAVLKARAITRWPHS